MYQEHALLGSQSPAADIPLYTDITQLIILGKPDNVKKTSANRYPHPIKKIGEKSTILRIFPRFFHTYLSLIYGSFLCRLQNCRKPAPHLKPEYRCRHGFDHGCRDKRQYARCNSGPYRSVHQHTIHCNADRIICHGSENQKQRKHPFLLFLFHTQSDQL